MVRETIQERRDLIRRAVVMEMVRDRRYAGLIEVTLGDCDYLHGELVVGSSLGFAGLPAETSPQPSPL